MQKPVLILASTIGMLAVLGGSYWAAQLDGIQLKNTADSKVQILLETTGDQQYRIENGKNNDYIIYLPKAKLPTAFQGTGLPAIRNPQSGVTATVQESGDGLKIHVSAMRTGARVPLSEVRVRSIIPDTPAVAVATPRRAPATAVPATGRLALQPAPQSAPTKTIAGISPKSPLSLLSPSKAEMATMFTQLRQSGNTISIVAEPATPEEIATYPVQSSRNATRLAHSGSSSRASRRLIASNSAAPVARITRRPVAEVQPKVDPGTSIASVRATALNLAHPSVQVTDGTNEAIPQRRVTPVRVASAKPVNAIPRAILRRRTNTVQPAEAVAAKPVPEKIAAKPVDASPRAETDKSEGFAMVGQSADTDNALTKPDTTAKDEAVTNDTAADEAVSNSDDAPSTPLNYSAGLFKNSKPEPVKKKNPAGPFTPALLKWLFTSMAVLGALILAGLFLTMRAARRRTSEQNAFFASKESAKQRDDYFEAPVSTPADEESYYDAPAASTPATVVSGRFKDTLATHGYAGVRKQPPVAELAQVNRQPMVEDDYDDYEDFLEPQPQAAPPAFRPTPAAASPPPQVTRPAARMTERPTAPRETVVLDAPANVDTLMHDSGNIRQAVRSALGSRRASNPYLTTPFALTPKAPTDVQGGPKLRANGGRGSRTAGSR